MYSVNIKEKLIISHEFLDINLLLPHEEVITERMNNLVSYLNSLKPYIIIPSILICSKTNMIIDGHHRFYALKKLGFLKIPVTKINYNSDSIKTHIENNILKSVLLNAALSGNILPPKSSFHHVIDFNNKLQPIILLSVLTKLDY